MMFGRIWLGGAWTLGERERETCKGADSHAVLSALIKTLLEDDAGDATLEGEIADLEARLKRHQAELSLTQLERRLTALNVWSWVLKPLE